MTDDFDPASVPPADDPLADPGEVDLKARLVAAKALLDQFRPINEPGRFLEPDAVAAAALLHGHEHVYMHHLQEELRPFRILRRWQTAVLACARLHGTPTRNRRFKGRRQGNGKDGGAAAAAASIYPPDPHRNSATPPHGQPVKPPKMAETLDILGLFKGDVVLRGLVGESATAQLIYLSITSRLLAKPVSVGLKGHSSSGKSHTVDRVLEFFPDEAVVKFTGMSERALIYREDDYSHRTIVVYEVTALQEAKEDNLTAYFVRTLLSEGRLEYEVTVRNEDGHYTTQRIVKEGPTNLIFTTTKTRVHAENETRILSLTTDDGTEQTKKVFIALADETERRVNLKDWLKLQAWLQTAEHRVTIPYGRELAQAIPPLAVRLRRDFGAVLSLVRAHAILHQQTRGRDEAGRIVATVVDYAAVRALVTGVISEGIGASVSATVRDTVEAVRILTAVHTAGITVGALAKQLEIDKSNASRRTRRAADGGYIRNLEEKRGQPARWVVGEPLPEEVEILPAAEGLAQHATPRNAESSGIPGCCAVACTNEGVHGHHTQREAGGGDQDEEQWLSDPAEHINWTDPDE